MLDIARDRRKTLKKETKMKNKKEPINNKYVFPFTHLHRKIYILLEDIYGKT